MSKSRKRKEPNYGVMREAMAMLSDATPEQQRRIIDGMTAERLACFDAEFEQWAHKNQLPPNGEGWSTWLMMAGRGFGKTRAGAEWIYRLGESRPNSRIALVGATIAEARSIMVEGVSGLLSVARRHRRNLKWEPSLGRLRWPNGSQAQVFSGDNADGLRGAEHHFAWVLTFEVVADAEPPRIANLMRDASAGLILSDDQRALEGYAAYGKSIGDAVEPLIATFGISLFDDGRELRSPEQTPVFEVGAAELGNRADDKEVSRFHREQIPARAVPASLRLTHYDPSRDYQTGEARTSIGAAGSELQRDLPAVLSADVAKGLASAMLARAWATRDRLSLRLPTARITCTPGSVLTLPFAPSQWQVDSVEIESFVTVMTLVPATATAVTLAADPGRAVTSSDAAIGPMTIALFDIPLLDAPSDQPTLLLAATSAGPGWKARNVELRIAGTVGTTQTVRAKTILGRAVSPPGDGTAHLLDEVNSIEVELIDHDQWLTSCDADSLSAGANLAVLGNELIQFGRVEPLGDGRFRLSKLLRGRGGTDWASSTHVAGEWFCVLDDNSCKQVAVPLANIGGSVFAATATASATIVLQAESLRPLSPARLTAVRQNDGSIFLQWVRRSRAGLAWLDGVDAPLGETREQYRIVLASATTSVELSAMTPALVIEAATVGVLGNGPLVVNVEQIGDFAASRATQITLD